MAKKLHPDLNPGDKKAEEKFKEVTAAYDLLGDADKSGDKAEIAAAKIALMGALDAYSKVAEEIGEGMP